MQSSPAESETAVAEIAPAQPMGQQFRAAEIAQVLAGVRQHLDAPDTADMSFQLDDGMAAAIMSALVTQYPQWHICGKPARRASHTMVACTRR
jgi:hypothetical protein